jgi:NADPH2 dehydrogenase
MGMKDPVPQFSHFTSSLASNHPNLAYLHVIEPLSVEERLALNSNEEIREESIDFLRKIWSPRPFISCGGYTKETAAEVVAKYKGGNALAAFGQLFISNVRVSFCYILWQGLRVF